MTTSTRSRFAHRRWTRAAMAAAVGLATVTAVGLGAPASAAALDVTAQWGAPTTITLDPTCTFTNEAPAVSLATGPGNVLWVTLDGCDDGNSRVQEVSSSTGSPNGTWEVTPRFEPIGWAAAVDGSGLLTRPFDAVADANAQATEFQSRASAGSWSHTYDCPVGSYPAGLSDGGGNVGLWCLAVNPVDPDYLSTAGASNADISLGSSGSGTGRIPVGLRSNGLPTSLLFDASGNYTALQQWSGSSWTSTALSQTIDASAAWPAGSDSTGRALVFASTVNTSGYPIDEVTTGGAVNTGTIPTNAEFFANASVDDAGALYLAEFDLSATSVTLAKYTVAPAPVSGDTIAFQITGQITYSNSQTLSAGNLTILRDGSGIKNVYGAATFPSTVTGSATAFFNVSRFWTLPIYLGTVKLYDTPANIALTHVVFFSKVNTVSTTGATNTQGWVDFGHNPWRSYNMTWTVHDLA